MWKWIFENINGKHQQKKSELQNDDEYFEFMINDFNRRLQLTLMIGFVLGATTIGILWSLIQKGI